MAQWDLGITKKVGHHNFYTPFLPNNSEQSVKISGNSKHKLTSQLGRATPWLPDGALKYQPGLSLLSEIWDSQTLDWTVETAPTADWLVTVWHCSSEDVTADMVLVPSPVDLLLFSLLLPAILGRECTSRGLTKYLSPPTQIHLMATSIYREPISWVWYLQRPAQRTAPSSWRIVRNSVSSVQWRIEITYYGAVVNS